MFMSNSSSNFDAFTNAIHKINKNYNFIEFLFLKKIVSILD